MNRIHAAVLVVFSFAIPATAQGVLQPSEVTDRITAATVLILSGEGAGRLNSI
jgi:hypothetical protein